MTVKLLLFRNARELEYVVIVEDASGEAAANKEAAVDEYHPVAKVDVVVTKGHLGQFPLDRALIPE